MGACGYQTGVIWDAARSNWNNDGDRPIAWSAWYPTTNTTPDVASGSVFESGSIIRDAPLAGAAALPVVVLSHGTGGSAESLGWLARSLAAGGSVVIGANHHGNTSLEAHVAEGFLCWWERAMDVSTLLTVLATSGVFANRLNLDGVSAVGFSLGAHTVLSLAGGRTSLDRFVTWATSAGLSTGGPREFPDAADHIPSLLKTSPAFQRSWARQGDSFADTRIRQLVTLAPAPPIRSFSSRFAADLDLPLTFLSGGADVEAPPQHCAAWLARHNSRFQHHDLGNDVGHYTFLDMPSDTSLMGRIDIFTDRPGVMRSDVHRRAARLVGEAISLTKC